MISRELVQGMFDGARDNPWDIEGTCVWSYYFCDEDEQALVRAAPHLEARGYEVVGLLMPGEDDDRAVYFLQVDRVEAHSVDSLMARNVELYAFAAEHGLESYDGMDVGPVSE